MFKKETCTKKMEVKGYNKNQYRNWMFKKFNGAPNNASGQQMVLLTNERKLLVKSSFAFILSVTQPTQALQC